MLVVSALSVGAPAHAAGLTLSLQDLGTLDGSVESSAWGVDQSGRAVGYGLPAEHTGDLLWAHAAVWSGGSATDLPQPSNVLGTRALSATTNGDVAGYSVGIGTTRPLW